MFVTQVIWEVIFRNCCRKGPFPTTLSHTFHTLSRNTWAGDWTKNLSVPAQFLPISQQAVGKSNSCRSHLGRRASKLFHFFTKKKKKKKKHLQFCSSTVSPAATCSRSQLVIFGSFGNWRRNPNPELILIFTTLMRLIQIINTLFSEENEVPRTLLEAREVAGSGSYGVKRRKRAVCSDITGSWAASQLKSIVWPHHISWTLARWIRKITYSHFITVSPLCFLANTFELCRKCVAFTLACKNTIPFPHRQKHTGTLTQNQTRQQV